LLRYQRSETAQAKSVSHARFFRKHGLGRAGVDGQGLIAPDLTPIKPDAI
jgi:hypothetical protein